MGQQGRALHQQRGGKQASQLRVPRTLQAAVARGGNLMAGRFTSRRDFVKVMALGAAGAALAPRDSIAQAQATPRRFVIDAHQHFQSAPDYIERLVRTYRPMNAMACVLTPISGIEVVRKAAAEHPDVIIPYGHVNVDD